jgi:hypothetical protein
MPDPTRSYGEVPDNWQELHKCRGPLDDHGRCLFCKLNAPDGDAGKAGFELIPFDIPGVYDPKGEPHVLIRKRLRN